MRKLQNNITCLTPMREIEKEVLVKKANPKKDLLLKNHQKTDLKVPKKKDLKVLRKVDPNQPENQKNKKRLHNPIKKNLQQREL